MTNGNTRKPQARIVAGPYCARIEGIAVDALRSVLEAITPTPSQGGAGGVTLGFRAGRSRQPGRWSVVPPHRAVDACQSRADRREADHADPTPCG